MPRGPVSVQLYSVRNAIAEDLEGTLERIAGLGFRYVEPYSDFITDSDRYVAAFAGLGLEAPSAHAPVLRVGDAAEIFEAAAALGVRTVIDPHAPGDDWGTVGGIARLAERMNAASDRAHEFGLSFGYHNHWFELEAQPNGTPALEQLATRLDETVVLEVDTYWSEVGGVPAVDLLRRLGDQVRYLHVKDGPVNRDVKAQLPAGQGSMDVPAVLAAAPDAVRVIEFDDYTGDVFEGLAASLAYVTDVDGAA